MNDKGIYKVSRECAQPICFSLGPYHKHANRTLFFFIFTEFFVLGPGAVSKYFTIVPSFFSSFRALISSLKFFYQITF